jgi:AAA+ superfamily predicted ATPase
MIILPIIKTKSYNHYKELKSGRAKKPKKTYLYSDTWIEMSRHEAKQIVDMMDERPRFAGLKEYTPKIIGTMGQDYRTRFIIDAQTMNDCYLAMIYINYYLYSSKYYHHLSYDICYEYHVQWLNNEHFNANISSDDDVRILSKQLEDNDEKSHEDDKPIWLRNMFPVFIDLEADYAEMSVNSIDLESEQSLIYALESREPTFSCLGGGMGFPFISEINSKSSKTPKQTLLLDGFKTIHIPDAETDELKDIFTQISSQAGMSVSKSLKFDVLYKEYNEYFGSEYELQAVVRIIKEWKVFENRLSEPIVYKDFIKIFDTSEMRKSYAAAKNRNKKKDINPWDELNEMVGNADMKREVRKMVDLLLLEKRRKEYGLPQTRLTMHSVFYGAPGTSKTTVARLIAKILKHEGIIKSENFKECVKSDIVGQYVGWTAAGVDGLFKKLSDDGGGVLFLDEAYTYTEKDSTCFDKEAINCIVQCMENHRNVMCIFAGYKEPMQQFVQSNSGIRSRIGFVFEFPNYSAEEMYEIAEYQAKVLGFRLPVESRYMLINYFEEIIKLQGEFCGNGREARKILESAGLELASRLAQQKGKANKSDCTQLTTEDVEGAIEHSLERERRFAGEKKLRIGFGN